MYKSDIYAAIDSHRYYMSMALLVRYILLGLNISTAIQVHNLAVFQTLRCGADGAARAECGIFRTRVPRLFSRQFVDVVEVADFGVYRPDSRGSSVRPVANYLLAAGSKPV